MSDYPDKASKYSAFHEDIAGYCEGGYHPVHIGDIVNDRYLIVNELAFSFCSTVWLVEDLHQKRFASLKVISAEESAKSSETHIAQSSQCRGRLSCPSICPPPKYVIISGEKKRLLKLCLLSDKIHVMLCDFGEATIYDPHLETAKPPFVFNTPLPLRSPEFIFHDIIAPTFESDTWSLGILLFMIMNGRQPPFEQRYAPDLGVVNSMVWYLGKLPETWWTPREKRSDYYDEDGMHL